MTDRPTRGCPAPSVVRQSVLTNNASYGIFLVSAAALTLHSSVVAYNGHYNVFTDTSTGANTWSLTFNDLYASSGTSNHNLGTLPSGNLTVEPKFLSYSNGKPLDTHLALGSPLINTGDSAVKDADGSRADIGAYGGPDGAKWDLDDDGIYAWFWPGELSSAPVGFDPYAWDCDDLDASVRYCE